MKVRHGDSGEHRSRDAEETLIGAAEEKIFDVGRSRAVLARRAVDRSAFPVNLSTVSGVNMSVATIEERNFSTEVSGRCENATSSSFSNARAFACA